MVTSAYGHLLDPFGCLDAHPNLPQEMRTLSRLVLDAEDQQQAAAVPCQRGALLPINGTQQR